MAKKKQPDLYYMLPGMSRGARARAIRNLKVSIIVGLLLSGIIAGVLCYSYKL
jgi:hypothetical protein